jgi:hypothetical protein
MCKVELFTCTSPLLQVDEDDTSIFEGEYVKVSISLNSDDKLWLRGFTWVLMFCAATQKYNINSNIRQLFIINNII